MSAPAVSVLLPVRDGADTLYETIESLVSQSFGDFEVVAIDDGSTDETPRELRRWAATDDRVRVLTTAPQGIVGALERGRAAARGRYLARIDADDVAHSDRLAAQFDLMESRPGLAGCGSLVRYFPREALKDGALRYESWINGAVTPDEIERAIFVECPLAHPTFFFRADAVAAAGGYRDAGWPEDHDLVLRMWASGARFGKVDRVLLDWREGAGRLSRTDDRYGPEAFLACKVHHLTRTLLPSDRAAVIWGAGPVGKALSKALSTAGATVRAFVELDPRKIGQEIHDVPVWDTDEALRDRDSLHLAAVGQPGARGRIIETLERADFEALKGFVAMA